MIKKNAAAAVRRQDREMQSMQRPPCGGRTGRCNKVLELCAPAAARVPRPRTSRSARHHQQTSSRRSFHEEVWVLPKFKLMGAHRGEVCMCERERGRAACTHGDNTIPYQLYRAPRNSWQRRVANASWQPSCLLHSKEGEGGAVCGPRVFCPSKIPSFLARWRVRGPAGTGSVGDSARAHDKLTFVCSGCAIIGEEPAAG